MKRHPSPYSPWNHLECLLRTAAPPFFHISYAAMSSCSCRPPAFWAFAPKTKTLIKYWSETVRQAEMTEFTHENKAATCCECSVCVHQSERTPACHHSPWKVTMRSPIPSTHVRVGSSSNRIVRSAGSHHVLDTIFKKMNLSFMWHFTGDFEKHGQKSKQIVSIWKTASCRQGLRLVDSWQQEDPGVYSHFLSDSLKNGLEMKIKHIILDKNGTLSHSYFPEAL